MILRERLLKGLNIVSRFINSRSTLPVLETALLEVNEDGSLKMVGTNLGQTIVLNVPARFEDYFAICVSPSQLSSVLSARVEDMIELKYIDTSVELQIKCGNLKSKLKGYQKDDFVLIPERIDKNTTCLDSDDFMRKVDYVLPFAGDVNGPREQLKNVNFKFEDETLRLTTTDGFGMSSHTINIQGNDEYNIPADSLRMVINGLSSIKSDTIMLSYHDKNVCFSGDNFYIICSLYNGHYPDFSHFLGLFDAQTYNVTVDSALLQQSLMSGKIYINSDHPAIHLKRDGLKLTLTANSKDVGDWQDELNIISGNKFEVLINYDHLLTALKMIKGNVEIYMDNKNSGIFIKEETNQDSFWLTMPMYYKENKS